MPPAWLATTILPGASAQHAVVGNFRGLRPSDGAGYDVVLGRDSSIEVYEQHPSGLSLRQISCQQLWASISDLRLRPWAAPPRTRQHQHQQQAHAADAGADQLVLLSSSGNISLLHYSIEVTYPGASRAHGPPCTCSALTPSPTLRWRQAGGNALVTALTQPSGAAHLVAPALPPPPRTLPCPLHAGAWTRCIRALSARPAAPPWGPHAWPP
jgi:hypothetical protein